jgi:uncharacterized protein
MIANKKDKGETTTTIETVFSSDGKTAIKPVTTVDQIILNRPTLIVAFPGAGMVASISANYIIEQLQMHQIAYVDSEFAIPGIIYIGGKLRHPFRLYASNDGKLCVIICEIPIVGRGIHSVLNTLVKWAKNHNVREMIVLDGFPREGISPPGRKAWILSSNKGIAYSNGGIQSLDTVDSHSKDVMIFVQGISGGLLASCLSSGIKCKGVFIPSPNTIPDAEGAAILIDSISALGLHFLKLDSQPLRKKGEKMRNQMSDLIKVMLAQQEKEKSYKPGIYS